MNERAPVSGRTNRCWTGGPPRSHTVAAVARAVLALALLLPLGISSNASAQEWMKDRMYQEGQGFQTGDLEWHPGIAVEGGYDSNYFLRSSKTDVINGAPNAPVVGTPVMRVTPSLSLSTIGPLRREGQPSAPPVINFRLNAAGTYQEFFGQLQPEQRNFSVNSSARLDILPERPFGGALFASYSRIIQPNSVVGDPDLSFNHDTVGAGAEVSTQPGGGTLDWHLGYQFSDTLFEENAGASYANLVNTFYTKGRWKFRPRTAIVYDGTLAFFHYENPANVVAGTLTAGAISPLYDSVPLRTRIGINGLITPRLSFLGMVGYGGSFFVPATPNGNPPAQFDSVIGQAEFKFYLTAQPGDTGLTSLTLSSIALGYSRDFATSYLADFYTSDRGYLKFSYFFAGRALISLSGGVGAIEYPTFQLIGSTTNNPAFTDVRIDTTLYGEYRFTNYLGLTFTAKYTNNLSNEEIELPAAATGVPGMTEPYAMEWQRLELYAGVRLFL
jgi:hypothetical protein